MESKKTQIFLENQELCFIILIGILVFFLSLGRNALTNWDEAWYADVTRNLLSSSNPFLLKWRFLPFWDQPPLFFWLSTPAVFLLGQNEFAYRFTSATFGLISVILLYFVGKSWFNRRIGFFSSLVLLSTIQYLYRSRQGNIDSLLSCLFLLSVYLATKVLSGGKSFAFFGILGLLLITKTGIGALVLVIVVFYLLISRQKIIGLTPLVRGFLLTGAIVLPWYLINYLYFGNDFILRHFFVIIKSRLDSAFSPQMLSLFWFIPVLKSGLKIWFPFLLLAIPFSFFYLRKNRKIILTFSWFFLVFFFFSFAKNKDNWHIIPLYPAAAIIIGNFFSWLSDSRGLSKRKIYLMSIFLATFNLVSFKDQYIVNNSSKHEKAVSQFINKMSKPDDHIILDDHFFPVAVFYSERKLEFNRLAGAGDDWATLRLKNIVTTGSFDYIITNEENLLKADIKNPKIVFKSGEKIVIRK